MNDFERTFDEEGEVSMVMRMEAGKPYYIDIAYVDVYQVGTFNFSVEYLGESYKQFTAASPGYYTVPDDGELSDDPAEIDALGIDVMLGSDGYYHEKLADGSEGSIVYADFTYATGLFNLSINEMIELGAFDFSRTESDQQVQNYIDQYGDKTKGIENVELAMKEGYSTATEAIRDLGFGAGMGLPNMKRYSDEMEIITKVNCGTTVILTFYIAG